VVDGKSFQSFHVHNKKSFEKKTFIKYENKSNLLKNSLINHRYVVVLYLLIEFCKNDDHNVTVQVIDYYSLMVLLHNLFLKAPN
jgi:hypothetical protein